MYDFWTILELEPTQDVSVIKRAYAMKAKTCHPEDDPEGFLNLRRAYEAALQYAEGGANQMEPPVKPEHSQENSQGELFPDSMEESIDEDLVQLLHEIRENFSDSAEEFDEEDGWYLRDGGPESADNPYADGEAIRDFMDIYTGKQRKDSKRWMDYFTSDAFLTAGWDSRFTALLLEKVTEMEQDFPPCKEFLMWLCTAYQFSVKKNAEINNESLHTEKQERQMEFCPEAWFDGMESILRIAAKGPFPKRPGGNELALLESFKDYRHLVRLAENGAWNAQAMEEYMDTLNHYVLFYIKERCDPKANMEHQRHQAGLRLILHFFRREDLSETLYRETWRKLDLKSAIMGRPKILYGPLRELVMERVPGIAEETPENFLQLNRDHNDYRARIKADPEREDEESAAFFQREDFQKALRSPRFVKEQLLTYTNWRREGMGAGLVRRMLEFYRENLDIPRAEEVVKGLEEDLRARMIDVHNREDARAEVCPPDARLTLCYRPLLRYWLNTAFLMVYHPALPEYLSKYLPYQADWSRRFAEGTDGSRLFRTVAMCMGVEADCYPRHVEYRIDGKPIYRPCLPFEKIAEESGDWFLFLLPLTVAPGSSFSDVSREILPHINAAAIPEEDRDFIAQCLAACVCCLPEDEDSGEPLPPEKVLPLTLFAETEEQLFGCSWMEEEGDPELFEQIGPVCRVQKRCEAAPGDAETVARRLLAEAVSLTNYDLSLLKELPLQVYVLPLKGPEYMLGQESAQTAEPNRGKPVTEESLAELLGQFARKELRRLELKWYEGKLVFVKDTAGYACFFFEQGDGHDIWNAMLSQPEVYRTVDSNDVVYVPFGMGKLQDYCIHRSPGAILRNLDRVFPEMGQGRIASGGPSGWLWNCNVNQSNGQHKLFMAQQKLGGFPPHRSRNHVTRNGFVFSRYPIELEKETLNGEKELVEIRIGGYGSASAALLEFMGGKLARLRLTWTFRGPEPTQNHLILLQKDGRFLMAWLEDDRKRAAFCAAEDAERETLPGRLRSILRNFCHWWANLIHLGKKGNSIPAKLLHRDLWCIRNCVDLLLDDIDYTEPVVERYFLPSAERPYEELRSLLVKD